MPCARNLSTSICSWFQCLTSLTVPKFFVMAKLNICCYNFKLLFSFAIPSGRGKAVSNLPLLKQSLRMWRQSHTSIPRLAVLKLEVRGKRGMICTFVREQDTEHCCIWFGKVGAKNRSPHWSVSSREMFEELAFSICLFSPCFWDLSDFLRKANCFFQSWKAFMLCRDPLVLTLFLH